MEKGRCECCLSITENCLADEIANLLSLCFSIQVFSDFSNESSTYICNVCCEKLKDCNDFRLRILETQFKLIAIRSSVKSDYTVESVSANFEPEVVIKEEPTEDYMNVDNSIVQNQISIKNKDIKINIDSKKSIIGAYYIVKSNDTNANPKNCEKEISSHFENFTHMNDSTVQNRIHPSNKEMEIRIDRKKLKIDKKQTVKMKKKITSPQTSGTKRREYLCNFCLTKFDLSSRMKSHIQLCHFEEIKDACTICGKRFTTKKDLMSHIVKHTDAVGLKRKSYSIEFKKKTVEESRDQNLTIFCKKNNLDLRMVRKWRAEYEKLSYLVDEGNAKKRKYGSGRHPMCSGTEDFISDRKVNALNFCRAKFQEFSLMRSSKLDTSVGGLEVSQR